MNIPFVDLKSQYQRLEHDIRARVDAVLKGGSYIKGPEVGEFEERLADFVGARHAISCSSGTDALLMGLMAYGIGPGDAVFTTPFTFIATAEVIALLGATPIFVDIDPLTFNMDPAQLEKAILAIKLNDPSIHPLPRTVGSSNLTPKGIIPVDLYGLPFDFDPVMELAEKHGLFVLEDAAQGFGGLYKGKRAGTLGHVSATSFFPAKPLGCYGDGGAIFTNDNDLAEKMTSIREHGKGRDRYENVRIGINGRLDTIQAAVLLVKLEVFPQELEERQRIAAAYAGYLSSNGSIITPRIPEGFISAWAQYSVLSDRRSEIQSALAEAKIPSMVYYPKPLHLQTAFSYLGYKEGDFPISERCSRRIFSIPMHPYLSDKAITDISNTILQCIA